MAYSMDKTSLHELRDIFVVLDTEATGTVTLMDLKKALQEVHSDRHMDDETIEKLFHGIDGECCLLPSILGNCIEYVTSWAFPLRVRVAINGTASNKLQSLPDSTRLDSDSLIENYFLPLFTVDCSG